MMPIWAVNVTSWLKNVNVVLKWTNVLLKDAKTRQIHAGR